MTIPNSVLVRIAKLETQVEELKKFNPNHDQVGRFSSGSGGGGGKGTTGEDSSVTGGPKVQQAAKKLKDAGYKKVAEAADSSSWRHQQNGQMARLYPNGRITTWGRSGVERPLTLPKRTVPFGSRSR